MFWVILLRRSVSDEWDFDCVCLLMLFLGKGLMFVGLFLSGFNIPSVYCDWDR